MAVSFEPTASDAAIGTDARSPKVSATGFAILVLFLASSAWTMWHRSELTALARRWQGFGLLASVMALGVAAFVVGECILAYVGAAEVLKQEKPWSLIRPVRAFRAIHAALGAAPRHRWFLTGWLLASFGSLVPGPTLTAAIVLSLPSRSWGVAALPLADFIATLVVRVPIHQRIVRNRRSGGREHATDRRSCVTPTSTPVVASEPGSGTIRTLDSADCAETTFDVDRRGTITVVSSSGERYQPAPLVSRPPD